jgi:MFS family permease
MESLTSTRADAKFTTPKIKFGAGLSAPSGFWESHLAPFFDKHFLILCLCFIGIACARIISTYDALSLTVDEPIHLACGLEYIANHVYRLEPSQPPLSRSFQSVGPFLAGARPVDLPKREDVAYADIAQSGNVNRTIFLMRLGTLPFFLLACTVVCGWAWHAFGKAVAVVAVALYTLLPTVLADAGLATTDTALGATVGAAFLAAIIWAEKPNWLWSILLGFFAGLACLAKFTALGYLPVTVVLALVVSLATRWPGWRGLVSLAKQRAVMILLSAGVASLVIWAGYLFSVGSGRLPFTHLVVPIPAPELLDGIRANVEHDHGGHGAYLLGQFRMTGWWYYFPVALAVKTPIAFMVFLLLGAYVCIVNRRVPTYLYPLVFILGILFLAMRVRIDIGIRHVEPIYIGLSVVAALGVARLLEWCRTAVISAITAGGLVAWMVISVAVYHPDYLTYFNGFAGKHPENILVDSNYDWGQDLRFLAKRLHELHVSEFSLASSWEVKHDAYLESWYGLPAIKRVSDSSPSSGWTVVSPTYDKATRFTSNGLGMAPPWYDHIAPTERVGALLLYYTPASTLPDPLSSPAAVQRDQGAIATPR